MTLRYSDRHPREERTPDCYGKEAYFDPRASECRGCHFEYDCRDAIHGGSKSASVPIRRADRQEVREPTRMSSRRGPDERTHAGIVLEGETGLQRFAKDCLTGACRGLFEEGSDFFRYWRW